MDKLYIKRKQKSRVESKFLFILPHVHGRETVQFVTQLRIVHIHFPKCEIKSLKRIPHGKIKYVFVIKNPRGYFSLSLYPGQEENQEERLPWINF